MTLPTSRNTTYAPGSQVKSDDLNDIQDEVIALYEGRGGARTLWIHGGDGTPEDSADAFSTSAAGLKNDSGSSALAVYAVRLPVGATITDVQCRITAQANAGTRSAYLYRLGMTDDSAVAVDSGSSTATSSSYSIDAMPVVASHALLADQAYAVVVVVQDDDFIRGIKITYTP